jgi:hypothetical protein
MTAILETDHTSTNHSPYVRIGRHRCTRPRTLNIVDLENLVGGDVDISLVRDAWSEFVGVTGARYGDHSAVAVAKCNAASAFFGLPSNIHRIVGLDQPDGADIALIDSIDIDWATHNFGQIVIASGDHIFAPVAREFRDAGLRVAQVIGAGHCSTDLYLACDEHRYLNRTRKAVLARRRPTTTQA